MATGDAEALRLAVDVLRRENEIREMDPWEGKSCGHLSGIP